jgi:hypothetical protein
MPNVVSEAFVQLLLATLQVPSIARTDIHALEVASEDLLEILLVADDVSR